MVRYAPGEFFAEHHDGKFRPRTVFIYLTDVPEGDGGETYFPFLGLKFTPRRGTAVIWPNAKSDGSEDSRMLHQGSAPKSVIKYGVNSFFNAKPIRRMWQNESSVPLQMCAVVDVQGLPDERDDSDRSETKENMKRRRCTLYVLSYDPKVVAIPKLLSEADVSHVLELADCAGGVPGGADAAPLPETHPLCGGTRTIRKLELAETPEIMAMEARIAECSVLYVDNLARLRVVQPGTDVGLCNRGCGPKSAYCCLSEQDEVYFPLLGMRFLLRAGDALIFPNCKWESGECIEDTRTMRAHIAGGDAAARPIGLDAFFHDLAIRTLQTTVTAPEDSMVDRE